jgi:O-antigen/teichoic acid export membrane protein
MLKIFKQKSVFVKNVTTLVTGTAISQIINILSTPILTRIYSPGEFAVFQIFYSVAAIISVVATLRFEYAIVAPKEEEEALDIISICFYSSFVIAILSLLILLFWRFKSGNSGNFNSWYFLIPVYVVFAGLMQSLNFLSLRRQSFKLNLAARISSVLATAIGGIGLGMAGLKPAGLIIGNVLGQFTGFIVLLRKIPNVLLRPFHRITNMKETFIRHKNYPLFNAPHALVDTFQDQGITFVLNYYFTANIVSFYGQGFRILKAPIGFIGSSIYQVIYPKFTEMSHQGIDLRSHVKKIYLQLLLLGLPFFTLLWFFATPIFRVFFGEKWAGAGEIAGVMAPWLFLNFIVSPVSCFALIRNKQRKAMMITIIEIILRFSAIIIGGIYGSYMLGFKLLTIAGCGIMIYALIWYYQLSAVPKTEIA